VGVLVAARSVVAVRWAFRQHAATEVGVLVRLGPRQRWVSWSGCLGPIHVSLASPSRGAASGSLEEQERVVNVDRARKRRAIVLRPKGVGKLFRDDQLPPA
jgi:hypothetical protein